HFRGRCPGHLRGANRAVSGRDFPESSLALRVGYSNFAPGGNRSDRPGADAGFDGVCQVHPHGQGYTGSCRERTYGTAARHKCGRRNCSDLLCILCSRRSRVYFIRTLFRCPGPGYGPLDRTQRACRNHPGRDGKYSRGHPRWNRLRIERGVNGRTDGHIQSPRCGVFYRPFRDPDREALRTARTRTGAGGLMESLSQFYAVYGSLINFIGINAILALSLYVTLSAGQLSLGNAAFAGIGAYVSGILTMRLNMPYPVSIAAGAGLSAITALVIGMPVLRMRGIFLAMATLAFGEVVRIAAVNMDITGGAQGIVGIPNKTTTY